MKLYFNGCSYVHGDDMVWDYDVNPHSLELQQDIEYISKLKAHKLSSRVAKKLEAEEVYDHAGCGASNQLIAFQTLEFFDKLDPKERKNFIACIGWTAAPRMMFLLEPELDVECVDVTILPMWIENMKKRGGVQPEGVNRKRDFLEMIEPMHKPLVLATNDHYWYKEHLQLILCLQSYFNLHKIKYVFWNSLDNKWSNELWLSSLNNIVEWDHWVEFNYPGTLEFKSKVHLYEQSWIDRYWHQQYKTKSNHPNAQSAEEMAKLITTHIKKNGLVK